MGCIDSFFLAHKGPDGICRPFDIKPKTKQIDINIKGNYSKSPNSNYHKLSKTIKENKELQKKNYELKRDLDIANLKLKLKDKTLDNIKNLIDVSKDDISDNFRNTLLLLINTAKS